MSETKLISTHCSAITDLESLAHQLARIKQAEVSPNVKGHACRFLMLAREVVGHDVSVFWDHSSNEIEIMKGDFTIIVSDSKQNEERTPTR